MGCWVNGISRSKGVVDLVDDCSQKGYRKQHWQRQQAAAAGSGSRQAGRQMTARAASERQANDGKSSKQAGRCRQKAASKQANDGKKQQASRQMPAKAASERQANDGNKQRANSK